jgi:phage tail-like protein
MSVVSSAQARDMRLVRVVFSAAVPQVDPTAAGDALNPANYALAATTAAGGLVPTAGATVASVASITTTTVDLTTTTDLSPGRPYEVAASNITGLDPSPGSAELTAFSPPQPAGRAFVIADMIPRKNWREDDSGDLARVVACLQDQVMVLLATVDHWTDIIDPEKAPEVFTDSMLYDMGDPFSFGDLSLVDKRRLLLSLITIYRLKGAVVGIRSAINFFTGLDVDVIAYGGRNNVHIGPTVNSPPSGSAPPWGPYHLGPWGTSWIVGSDGSACQLLLKIGVPWVPSDWDATDQQKARIAEVVHYMKPANMVLQAILCPRLPAPDNVLIASAMAGSFTMSWAAVTGATGGYHVYWSYSAGVTYRNGTQVSVPTGTSVTIAATAGRRIYAAVMGIDPNTNEGVASDEMSVTITA